MKGKQLLKRVFLGALADAPDELRDTLALYDSPVHLESLSEARNFKVFYVVSST